VGLDFGFDFRSTAVFVTDPTYAAPVLAETFPTTYTNGLGQTMQAGWVSGGGNGTVTGLNRNVVDPRLSGINFISNTATPSFITFQVTLPAVGPWSITTAFGDTSGAQNQYVVLADNAVAFLTYTNIATALDSFMDTNGTVFTRPNWISSNVPFVRLFSSATFTIQLGPNTPTGANASTIAHLRLTNLGVAETFPFPTQGPTWRI